jgi:hypothetical protein
MPLTRHFYELDEVLASIIYTGSRSIIIETVFWCHELIISGHASEAISALFESWLWHRGPFHLSWLLEAIKRLGSSEIAEEDILFMAQQLSTCSVKDHSLWNLFAVSATDNESLFDRVTRRPFPVEFPTHIPLEQYILQAIHQHKAGTAWWAGLRLPRDRLWFLCEWYRDHIIKDELLTEVFGAVHQYEQLLGYRSEAYDNAMCGLVLLTLCLTTEQRRQSMNPLPNIQHVGSESVISKWNISLGQKSGRIYPIPYHGLYGIGLRGRKHQIETTMDVLFDIEKGMRGCAVWDELLDSIKTVKDREIFYQTYFPDDIPDEWTKIEKEKSHGAGVLQRTEQLTLWGYMRRYHVGRCRLLWNKKVGSDVLDKIILDESPFITLLSVPVHILSEIDESQLRPVHKRKVVYE